MARSTTCRTPPTANLRAAVANVAIFFGFVGVFTTVIGAADGLRLIPTAVLVVIGLAGLILVATVFER